MHINHIEKNNFNIINGYGENFVIVNEKKILNDIIISKNQLLEVNIKNIGSIKWQDLIELMGSDIDIILIGTKDNKKISNSIKNNIKKYFSNAIINEMKNHPACRTYNILATENRNVMAIILNL